ncbi:MAG: class I SAM-dependent methyltransferase [Roseburia sp.]|nr:class I SAM-dependent methyltransferase [Roseburia sp.]MCM1277621.1 class I SAM-dependent methyltransferase [Robinsoniella sp.]
MLQNITIDYYNKNAENFVEATRGVSFMETQDKFLNFLSPKGKILDFGCGSGRDTKYFMEKGYNVDATDGSEELCKIASDYTGIKVKQMLFAELDAVEKYDGIWACSSILHLPKNELKLILQKMAAALKKDGVIYASFKHGEFEGERNGRYFTDFTMKLFADYLQSIENLRIEEGWITGDVRPGRGEEKWLNLILRKQDIH